jgi:septum formation protein
MWKYEVMALPDIDESYPDDIPHEEIPEYLAKKKASAYISMMQDDALLITADTVVLLHGRILGKPLDKRDAKQMLRELSGETHRVITGVSLTSKQKQVSFSDTAHVTFAVGQTRSSSICVENI